MKGREDMPRAPRQKLKLLYIKEYLMRNTDENHAVTLREIEDYLNDNGISAERKSLYDDLELLRLYGLDILAEKKDRTVWYHVVSGDFEISELKLLVDAVQGSRFITEKKSKELIGKLEGLCSRHQAYELSRQLTVVNRIKSMNESIYYNVDKIHSAIRDNAKITFRYFDFNAEKQKVFRHGGIYYVVSPFALNWDDENYYLVAYNSNAKQIRHYRVDKMDSLSEVADSRREGRDIFEKVDITGYSHKVFSMFGGETVKLRLEFANSLAGVVLDRFGKDIFLSANPDGNSFRFDTEIVVSPQFFGWLFSFGTEARILLPQRVKDDFADYIGEVSALYNSDEKPCKQK